MDEPKTTAAELVRGDWAILGCLLLESLADGLADGCLLLFLSENLGASDTLAALTLGVVSVFAAAYMVAAGRLLDGWPRRGPMGAAAVSRAAVAVVQAAMAALGAAVEVGALSRGIGFRVTFVLLTTALMAAKALGALAYTLAIKRAAVDRSARVRPALYQLQYAVVNVAALLASLLTSALRAGFEAHGVAWANVGALACGALLSAVTAAVAARLYIAQARDIRFWSSRRSLEREGLTCSCPTWTPELAAYLVLGLLFVGTRAAFEWQGSLLPKYMIRRFDASSTFPLFLAIDPLLLIAAATALPFTPLARAPVVTMLVAGTLLIALAPLWLLAADLGTGIGIVAAYMVQFALGEAVAMPLLTEYAMQIVPSGREGTYASVAQVPRVILGVVLTSAGGWLLAAFCPLAPATTCAQGAGRLWLVVAAISAITPIGLALRAAVTR